MGLGDLRRVPTPPRRAAQGHQRRRHGRPLRGAVLRDGRAQPRPEHAPSDADDRRRCRLVDEAIARRRARVLDLPDAAATGARRPPGAGHLAHADELLAIAEVMGRTRRGASRGRAPLRRATAPSWRQARAEVGWMADVTRHGGRPLTFGLAQSYHRARAYRGLELAAEANAAAPVRPQTTARGIGILFGASHPHALRRTPPGRRCATCRSTSELAACATPTSRARSSPRPRPTAREPTSSGIYVLERPRRPTTATTPPTRLPAVAAARGRHAGRGLHRPVARDRRPAFLN